jgi:thiamine-monophosphate kinase
VALRDGGGVKKIMDKNKLKIDELGEFSFIETIKDNCHYSFNGLIQGIGDDCAVIGPYNGNVFLITTDMLVEDIHFIIGRIDPEHLGQKVIAVNLSDIAAMGGTPLHGVISMAIPKSMQVTTIHAIYDGMKEMCRRYSLNIIGGDTCASPHKLIINVAIIGETPENEVLYRKGAKHGDKIYVTGTLGDSAGGLKIVKEEFSAPERVATVLMNAHNLPVPFIETGRMTAQSKLAGAMIDLSDGFVSDLRHICNASGVGARILHHSIPISDEIQLFAKHNDLDPYELGLYGGEDYRLLITVPSENCERFKNLFKKDASCRIYEVGEITVKKGIRIVMADGKEEDLSVKGYDHFIEY